MKRKAGRLQAQTEGSSIVEKLQQELGEYREILKCDICLDRTKQVFIGSISVICCLIKLFILSGWNQTTYSSRVINMQSLRVGLMWVQ